MLGLAFALVAVGVGLAVAKALRLAERQLPLAPVIGLGVMLVLTTWLGVMNVPVWLRGLLLVVLALAGIAATWRAVPRPSWTAALVAAALITPTLLLGLAFNGLEVPPSTHDGAFHVETIDGIRRGASVVTWYPTGFHNMLAALLALLPWLDTARGTLELTQGLAVLAPLAVLGIGTALGMRPIVAAAAALIQAITFLFPYDFHLWGGWPLADGVLLAVGLWGVVLSWLRQADIRWAVLAGLLIGAIALTHGTELLTAALGFIVLAVLHGRGIRWRTLAPHASAALLIAVVLALPYVPTALGWASKGGAGGVGTTILDAATAQPDVFGRADWLQFALGISGAGSALDLPLRLALIGLAMWGKPPRALVGLWVAFVLLLLVLDFTPWLDRLFVLTFPWLVDHRPRQVAVTVASLLEAYGLGVGAARLALVRARWRLSTPAARRAAIACALILGFFAEGDAVGIYKRLSQSVADQNLYSRDDNAAMTWLRQHVQPGDVLANDRSADAGIWAPYKADVPILLPRSLSRDIDTRQSIVAHASELDAVPAAEADACALRVRYLYQGALESAYDARLLPSPSELAQSQNLEEVFRSGPAVVFRLKLPC